MRARLLAMMILTLALCALSAPAGEDKFARQKNKDGLIVPKKDVPKDDNVKVDEKGKKDEKAGKTEAKGVTGKVKSVNQQKASFTLAPETGKDKTFLVTDKTKFLGPRGAVHEEGLRDESMAKGNEVVVVPASDEKFAKEVMLPPWKETKKKKGG